MSKSSVLMFPNAEIEGMYISNNLYTIWNNVNIKFTWRSFEMWIHIYKVKPDLREP